MPPPANIFRQITAAPTNEMAKGTKINGIGSDEVFGIIDKINTDSEQLPIGIAKDAVLKNDVKKGITSKSYSW